MQYKKNILKGLLQPNESLGKLGTVIAPAVANPAARPQSIKQISRPDQYTNLQPTARQTANQNANDKKMVPRKAFLTNQLRRAQAVTPGNM